MNIQQHSRAIEAVNNLAHFYMKYGEIERAMYLLEVLQRLEALPEKSVATLGWCYSFFSKTEELEQLMSAQPPRRTSIWQERLRAVIDILRGNLEQGRQRFERTLVNPQPMINTMTGAEK